MQYSKFTPQRCISTTDKSTQIFKSIMLNNNIKYSKSSSYQDIHLHIDYFLTFKNNKTYSIDIKSNKMLMDNDTNNPNYWWVWVELTNVLGNKGWLLGEADLIGFVFPSQLWLIKRTNLYHFFSTNVQNILVPNKSQANYKLYQRHNRKDIISRLNLLDIQKSYRFFKLK